MKTRVTFLDDPNVFEMFTAFCPKCKKEILDGQFTKDWTSSCEFDTEYVEVAVDKSRIKADYCGIIHFDCCGDKYVVDPFVEFVTVNKVEVDGQPAKILEVTLSQVKEIVNHQFLNLKSLVKRTPEEISQVMCDPRNKCEKGRFIGFCDEALAEWEIEKHDAMCYEDYHYAINLGWPVNSYSAFDLARQDLLEKMPYNLRHDGCVVLMRCESETGGEFFLTLSGD